jgi:hypothetical protein
VRVPPAISLCKKRAAVRGGRTTGFCAKRGLGRDSGSGRFDQFDLPRPNGRKRRRTAYHSHAAVWLKDAPFRPLTDPTRIGSGGSLAHRCACRNRQSLERVRGNLAALLGPPERGARIGERTAGHRRQEKRRRSRGGLFERLPGRGRVGHPVAAGGQNSRSVSRRVERVYASRTRPRRCKAGTNPSQTSLMKRRLMRCSGVLIR